MLADRDPLESVAGAFWVMVPSLEFSVRGRFDTGLPFESAAATDSNQGPLGDPAYAGVPRITRLAAAVTGVIVNCAADDVPPPGVGVVMLITAVPADDSWALGINAVRLVEDT